MPKQRIKQLENWLSEPSQLPPAPQPAAPSADFDDEFDAPEPPRKEFVTGMTAVVPEPRPTPPPRPIVPFTDGTLFKALCGVLDINRVHMADGKLTSDRCLACERAAHTIYRPCVCPCHEAWTIRKSIEDGTSA